jgi:hypothetical protein
MSDKAPNWPSPEFWDKVARLAPEARQLLMAKLKALLEEMDRDNDPGPRLIDLDLPE